MKALVLGIILIFAIIPFGTISPSVAFGANVDSPRKQMESGIEAEDVVCNVGLTLMIRYSGTAACVKPASADKLSSLGWGEAVEGYKIMTKEMMEESEITKVGYTPTDREFYLFTQVDENIDEEALGIFPDQYSMKEMVVNQGDTVRIHFYNLEEAETEEHHTFTISDPAYNIHEDVNAGDDTVIEFTADTPGVFRYYCTFHQPTMSGELIVLPKGSEPPSKYTPADREVYLFSQVDEHIDEEALGIFPDQYSMKQIVANQGDTVRIHFYNLEPAETEEHHTFTISDPAYNIHEDVNAGDDTVIEFTADTPGIFKYYCTFHQPTMSGELIVLPEGDEAPAMLAPSERELYLFSQVDEHIDEEALGIFPDQYSMNEIVVNKGDTVKIHFYNIEPAEEQEHHTFTISDPAYNIHEDVNAGDDKVIEFTADTPGIFKYYCTFHQPTMSGELIVLG